jgi:hypothetical protein
MLACSTAMLGICFPDHAVSAEVQPENRWPGCVRIVDWGEAEHGLAKVAVVERSLGPNEAVTDDTIVGGGRRYRRELSQVGMNGLPTKSIPLSRAILGGAKNVKAIGLTASRFAVASQGKDRSQIAVIDDSGQVLAAADIAGAFEIEGLTRINRDEFLVYGHRSGFPTLIVARVESKLGIREIRLAKGKSFASVVKARVGNDRDTYAVLLRESDRPGMEDATLALAVFDAAGRKQRELRHRGFVADFERIGSQYMMGVVDLEQAPATMTVLQVNAKLEVVAERRVEGFAPRLPLTGVTQGAKGNAYLYAGNEVSAAIVEVGDSLDQWKLRTAPQQPSAKLSSAYFAVPQLAGIAILAQQVSFDRSLEGRTSVCPQIQVFLTE